ncbi:FHA domain-containing protein [Actinomadura harenae]|uniref:FHA domain-containing protein n=1 Tax=Actinomadura harenae TaxID=2483351 RepID=A0A3M2LAK5_9ACTN|nr:FHA domain-containing protein [Actinomadura harenae]RMI34621.1 FHA domain-containing protein [Actinomadura harenae]
MALCPAGHTSGSDDYCDVCGERIGGSSAPPAMPPAGPLSVGAPPAPPTGGMSTQAMVMPGMPCPDCGTPAADRFCEQCGYDFATGGGRPSPHPAGGEPSNPMPAPNPPMPPGPPPGPKPGPPSPPPLPHPGPQPGPPPLPPQPGPPHPGPPVTTPPVPPGPPVTSGPAQTEWVAVIAADRAYYDAVIAMNGPDAARIVFPPFAPERRIPLSGERVLIGRRSPSRGTDPQIDLRQPPEDPGVSHTHAVLLARTDGRWSLVDPGSANGTCVNGSTDPIPNNVEVPVGEGDRVHVGAWTTITLTRGGTP